MSASFNMPLALPEDWDLKAYHYHLPLQLIAQHPVETRGHSRMMVLSRKTERIEHHTFYEIISLLPSHAILVLNNTRVLPARLLGQRRTGGKLEALLIQEQKPGIWQALVKPAKRIRAGENLVFCDQQIQATATERLADGTWLLAFNPHEHFWERLEQVGLLPLPPYIDRTQADEAVHRQDKERYQTCFSKKTGAIAAPTAGLHFTADIIAELQKRGIRIVEITLHVGRGTFALVQHTDIRQHPIHSEYFSLEAEAFNFLKNVVLEKVPIIAVGTTTVRVLETLAQQNFTAASGWTNHYIYPPYSFKIVQGLLTNFHLPQSSLMFLVAAFYGREKLLKAYRHAIEQEYRFFSYGDCMLIT